MDNLLNSKVLTYVLAFLALGAVIANALGYITTEIMIFVLSLGGFGGIAAFRDWINSQGYKTYLIIGVGALGVVAMALGWITLDQFIIVLVAVFGGSAASLAHALKKAPAGDKLKSVQVMKTG